MASRRPTQISSKGDSMVGAARFELATSCSRSKRSTRLSYAPIIGSGLPAMDGQDTASTKG